MTLVAPRIIAAFVMVVMSGLPVAAVLCARECAGVTHAASAPDNDAHCHETEAGGTATLRAGADDGCNPFAVHNVATRERISTPLGASAAAPGSLQLGDITASHHAWRASEPITSVASAGLSPGAQIPLRI